MKFLSITLIAALAHQTSAHGYLSQPAATFVNGIDTSFVATINETVDLAFQGLKWDDSPEANTAMFTNAFKNSQFHTLKELLDLGQPSCGHTLFSGQRVDVSDMTSMKWQNDQEGMGFIDTHRGPCEAWIDDFRVFQSDDCRADFTGYPAEIPIDYSSCSGDCAFTFYWLALQEPNWQIYKQCAPILNNNVPSEQPQATTSAPTAAPQTQSTDNAVVAMASETTSIVAATDVPVATDAPVVTDAAVASETLASATTTTTAATQSTESASTTSCKVRRRRRMTANLRSES